MSLTSSLTPFPTLAFPICDKPFVLLTDASAAEASAALTQENAGTERAFVYASHRWSATDARTGATGMEWMVVRWVMVHVRLYLAVTLTVHSRD